VSAKAIEDIPDATVGEQVTLAGNHPVTPAASSPQVAADALLPQVPGAALLPHVPPIAPLPDAIFFMTWGVTIKISELMMSETQGEPPAPFDERLHWLGGHLPTSVDGLQVFVQYLAQALVMDVQQVVVAFVFVDFFALIASPGSLRPETVRPLLLVASIQALKITLDERTSLSECVTVLGPGMPELTAAHLLHLELTLYKKAGWRLPMDAPDRSIYQPYAAALCGAANTAFGTSFPTPAMF